MVVIRTVDLYKSFKLNDHMLDVLKSISMSIDRGELLAITGKSGSGKTTLMNILGCLDVPTKGEYYLDGQNVAHLKQNELAHIRNKKIGFVFQQFNLLPDLTATENVALPLLYAGEKPKVARERAIVMLSKVDLNHRLNHFPYQLSGGQQQRISVARALINNPSIILADEPTGNLDSKTGKQIMELFLNLNKNQKITIIIVTHDEGLALQTHRMIKLLDGKVIEDRKLK